MFTWGCFLVVETCCRIICRAMAITWLRPSSRLCWVSTINVGSFRFCHWYIQGDFFYWAALKNDYVSNYIINPIEVSEFPKGLALSHFWGRPAKKNHPVHILLKVNTQTDHCTSTLSSSSASSLKIFQSPPDTPAIATIRAVSETKLL